MRELDPTTTMEEMRASLRRVISGMAFEQLQESATTAVELFSDEEHEPEVGPTDEAVAKLVELAIAQAAEDAEAEVRAKVTAAVTAQAWEELARPPASGITSETPTEEGLVDSPLQPRNAEAVALHSAQIAEQAARDILLECYDQIAMNINVVQKLDDPEGPHQLRIGLRRLRCAFSVFSGVLASPEGIRLSDEAREVGQAIGRLRDLDIVTNEIIKREVDAHPEEPNLSVLASALRRRADGMREQVRGILAGARTQTLLIDLARFVEMRGWLVPEDFGQTARLGAPLAQLAADALNKRWKKVGECARGLDTLSVEERHELRKQLKKLRYAVDFLSPLFPQRRAAPFVRRLRKLQNVLGEVNDAAAVRTILDSATPSDVSDAGTQRAIGWVLGASQKRAEISWARARAMWQKLEETKRFWK